MNNTNNIRRFEIWCSDGRCIRVVQAETSKGADRLCASLNAINGSPVTYRVIAC